MVVQHLPLVKLVLLNLSFSLATRPHPEDLHFTMWNPCILRRHIGHSGGFLWISHSWMAHSTAHVKSEQHSTPVIIIVANLLPGAQAGSIGNHAEPPARGAQLARQQ